MWRVTGEAVYREWAWAMALSMTECGRARFGFSGLRDHRSCESQSDEQESFFISETIKYLLLLHSPDGETERIGCPRDFASVSADLAHAGPGDGPGATQGRWWLDLREWVLTTEGHPVRVRPWDRSGGNVTAAEEWVSDRATATVILNVMDAE
jgi:hypothetical protein